LLDLLYVGTVLLEQSEQDFYTLFMSPNQQYHSIEGDSKQDSNQSKSTTGRLYSSTPEGRNAK